MLSKNIVRFILFTCLINSIRGRHLPRKGCYECEEEVWEEVPCNKIPTNTTVVPTSPTPTLPTSPASTQPTTTATPSTTHSPATCRTTMPTPVVKPCSITPTTTSTTPQDPYKKCYCECKMGCKEFCRKVVINPFEKQIVQVSKITEPIAKGHIESTHILQRELVTKSAKTCENNEHYKLSDVKESENQDDKMEKALPLPEEEGFEEDVASEPQPYEPLNVPATKYNSGPIVSPAEPIYGPYAVTEASVNNNIPPSSLYLPEPQQHPPYYGSFNPANDYNFAIPFEHLFSKVAKSVLKPIQNTGISLSATSATLAEPVESPYSEPIAGPIPGIDAPLASPGRLDEYDDSFNSFLMNVISDVPAKESAYQAFSKPFYSVPYNSI